MVNHQTHELHQQLRQLIAQACSHPPDTPERQRDLTKLIRAIIKSGKLWKDNDPNYGDALQKTWIYLCKNIDKYDPERASVITWLNEYLKKRLLDFKLQRSQTQKRKITGHSNLGQDPELSSSNPIENIPASPDIPPILEETREWAQADSDGELRRIHIKGHPEITCQVLILRRLPPETPWNTLAQEFGVSVSTLNAFYRRKCMPRLRKFGESQGYL
ncbi:MAG: sigma-70 family RNA polymerase sigma factor [Coleofasciculus sp. G3-WIS-01]|uniref:sigma-70 family RNA polymerase sigma factor n=1 Tax=Coleofasciculus sp. G3-WIS-01 TaxID=3069528 RepID=UPI0032F3A753